ncbi:uncharacterized protein PG998_003842 [Apiospora kogelbergensis]|uniref:Uncharacterized protein n=1 Tax=Apiospora kogelbergensis TaxID=1337665 RepID=A0AAW0QSU6_9PEZI
MQAANVLVLSPALPSELLTYILDHHVYPTTLIICSSRADFLESLINETTRDQQPAPDIGDSAEADNNNNINSDNIQQLPLSPLPPEQNIRLLSSPLYQLSISRHIRAVYTPTVTHLRAYLAVSLPNPSSGTIPPPPSSFRPATARRPPHLILYGLLALHRDTSEWSAQGLGTTCAAVAETGRRLGWRVEVADPPSPHHLLDDPPPSHADDDGRGEGRRRNQGEDALQELLKEKLPILSGGVSIRPGLFDAEEGGGWSGRAVEVGRVLSRWCDFGKGEWDTKFDGREV